MINIILSLLARLIMPVARIFIFIATGIAISITWLFQFLRGDNQPEPVKMILKAFFWGMLITLPVFLIELGASKLMEGAKLPYIISALVYWFLAIALVEEVFKYLVVRLKVLKSYEFDEPVDTMIYMVIVALGFAALENILYLLPPAQEILSFGQVLERTVMISAFRFIGATFLHALASATVGFFLALSICRPKRRRMAITFVGLTLAVLLHGLYNFSIIEIPDPWKLVIPGIILVCLAIFVILGFNKLKKMKSVCKI